MNAIICTVCGALTISECECDATVTPEQREHSAEWWAICELKQKCKEQSQEIQQLRGELKLEEELKDKT